MIGEQHIEDQIQMMVEKELHRIVEIDHRPGIGSTAANGHIAEVVQIHDPIDAEVGAGIEMQAEGKVTVVVAAVVVIQIHSVGRLISPPQMVVRQQNRLNDGQTINMMTVNVEEMLHGAGIPTTMTTMATTIDATIAWAMSHANGLVSVMISKQSDNLKPISWIHAERNVK